MNYILVKIYLKVKYDSKERSVLYEASSTKFTKEMRFELNLEGDQGRTREKAVPGKGATQEHTEL